MSLKVIPFSFFGSSESDLPIVAALNLSNPTTTSIDVEFSIFDDGTGAPITDFGIVYSSTDQDPVIGAPGVNQQSLGGTPPNIPGSYNGTVSGLSDTTEYYFKAYAINSEGTAYTPVKSLETQWDAFTYVFDAGRINYFTYSADLQIGNLTGGTTTINGVTMPLGNQEIKIKVSQPSNPNVTDEIHNRYYSNGRHKIFIPKNDNWDSSPIYISIAPISGTTFNNFRFVYSEDSDNEYNNGNILAAASAIVTHWGPTQWMSVVGMYAGDTFQINQYAPVCAADDTPDFSQCMSMHKVFKQNKRAYTNYYQPGDPNYLTAGVMQDISAWDVTNIQDTSHAFYNSWAGYGYPLVWTNMSWDNCVDFSRMFDSARFGQAGSSSLKVDMSGWTFNTDANADIRFDGFLANNQSSAFDGIGVRWFDINNIASNKLLFTNFFNTCRYMRFFGDTGYNVSAWGPKISQLEPLSNYTNSVVDLFNMFYFCGTNQAAGIDLDFTTWDFPTVTKADQMFAYTNFNSNNPYYATMLTNKTWGTNIVFDRISWQGMFTGAKNIPPLDNWTFNYVFNMDNMFWFPQAPAAPATQLDLSTWKTSIDALQPYKPSYTGSKGINADYMFYGGFGNVDAPLGIETWSWPTNANVDFITARFIVSYNYLFNRDVNNWNISKFHDFEGMFRFCTTFNNGEAAGLSGNPLTFTGTFMTTANTVAPVGGFQYMFQNCDAFNQSINSWGDLRKFNKQFAFNGMFYNTNSQPQAVYTHDIGGLLIDRPASPDTQLGQNIAAYWSTQQIDDTLIGWAKEFLTAGHLPTGGEIGWSTNTAANRPSCLPAASGGPYNVPGDINSVQDAIDFFTNQLGWTITLPACI